jgi:hypothetical protein
MTNPSTDLDPNPLARLFSVFPKRGPPMLTGCCQQEVSITAQHSSEGDFRP